MSGTLHITVIAPVNPLSELNVNVDVVDCPRLTVTVVGGEMLKSCTVRLTEAVVMRKCTMSSGVNVTESFCVPAKRTVPAGGEYTNMPGTLDVAFNCAALSAVP